MGYSPWGHKRVRLDLVTKEQQIKLTDVTLLSWDVLDTCHFSVSNMQTLCLLRGLLTV